MSKCRRCIRVTTVPAVCVILSPITAHAHYMTTPYVLPVPFWLYVYGCAVTLVVTFAILGYFFGNPAARSDFRYRDVRPTELWAFAGRCGLWLLRAGAVACLLLTIVSGLIGTLDPTRNITMTLFWVVFMLAFTYAIAFVGDIFELCNPWRTIAQWLERLRGVGPHSYLRYPRSLGYFPAFVFYVALIWIELFVLPNPRVIASALLAYTVITVIGAAMFGVPIWFKYAEFFGVFFRQIGTIAPVEYRQSVDRRQVSVHLRPPFVGALLERPDNFGLVLFVLFMLASTSYDAIHDTEMWLLLYWKGLIVLAQPLWGHDMTKSQDLLMRWFAIYKHAGLLLAPLIYLGVYVLAIGMTKKLAKTSISITQLALQFIPSLIPIAFVYNVCHYYTMLLSEIVNMPVLATDPFGFGWNIFGVELPVPSYLDMSTIWHTQVALILTGHVASVYLSHKIGLRVFPSRRAVILSQIPLLILMVAYTAIGLYILSLPLSVSELRD